MTKKSNPKPILGYTDTQTVKLDLDNMPFGKAKYWANRTMRWFRLRGFIILKSSNRCYHAVFDRPVPWKDNMRIVGWICLQSNHPALTRWFLLQAIKQGSTLRTSRKRDKPSPRVVYRYGTQNRQIQQFMRFRKLAGKLAARIGK